jgi:hypothetical protein
VAVVGNAALGGGAGVDDGCGAVVAVPQGLAVVG